MSEDSTSQKKINQGKELASQLFDFKLTQLQTIPADEKARLRQVYAELNEEEFEDILRQVIAAKTTQQEMVGWQIIPHDLAVILISILAWVSHDLRIAVIAGVALLVLLENIFQRSFNSRIYRPLSITVWLTYPAYLAFAYYLYRIDLPWYGIALGIVCLWGGTLLLGIISRIPTQLFMQARLEANKKLKDGQPPKK
jgi:hypothetical protein